ncbi:MAG: hypothetical protein WCR46_24735 [Deltaproteobacteria bacterium]
MTGDFYFTGPIKVEISQEPTKSDSKSKMEALYWQSIMNDNDPAVFESEGIIVKTGKTIAVKSGKLKPTAVAQQTAADASGLPATPQPEYRLTIDSNPADAKTTIPLPQDVQIVAPDPTLSP